MSFERFLLSLDELSYLSTEIADPEIRNSQMTYSLIGLGKDFIQQFIKILRGPEFFQLIIILVF
jgi:hypothetical protein